MVWALRMQCHDVIYNSIFNQEFFHVIRKFFRRRWNDVSVTLGTINETFRLVFEAQRGDGDQGYTAIDDVTVRHTDGNNDRAGINLMNVIKA